MVKHLTAHGNSAALIIDKPILDILKISMDTPLELSTDGKNLIVSPIKDAQREEKFKKAAAKIMKRHHKTFEDLAK